MKNTIQIPFVINSEFVDNVMVTALTGGINYWYCNVEIINSCKAKDNGCASAVANGGKIRIVLKESFDAKNTTRYTLDFDKFCVGFKRYVCWCMKQKRHFYTDACDIDDVEADIIIQLALFNKVVFG